MVSEISNHRSPLTDLEHPFTTSLAIARKTELKMDSDNVNGCSRSASGECRLQNFESRIAHDSLGIHGKPRVPFRRENIVVVKVAVKEN